MSRLAILASVIVTLFASAASAGDDIVHRDGNVVVVRVNVDPTVYVGPTGNAFKFVQSIDWHIDTEGTGRVRLNNLKIAGYPSGDGRTVILIGDGYVSSQTSSQAWIGQGTIIASVYNKDGTSYHMEVPWKAFGKDGLARAPCVPTGALTWTLPIADVSIIDRFVVNQSGPTSFTFDDDSYRNPERGVAKIDPPIFRNEFNALSIEANNLFESLFPIEDGRNDPKPKVATCAK